MKKYLYALCHKAYQLLKSPLNRVKNTHQLFVQIESPLNPYRVFKTWCLDVLQYGFVAEIIRLSLLGYKGFGYSIVMIICFGLMRWFWLDIIKETRHAIK